MKRRRGKAVAELHHPFAWQTDDDRVRSVAAAHTLHIDLYLADVYFGVPGCESFRNDDREGIPVVNSSPNRPIARRELRVRGYLPLEKRGSPGSSAIANNASRQLACASTDAP